MRNKVIEWPSTITTGVDSCHMINEHSVHSSIVFLEMENELAPENKIVFSDDEHLSGSDIRSRVIKTKLKSIISVHFLLI